MQENYTRNAVQSLAFDAWLRSGSVLPDLFDLPVELEKGALETKGNPYHDPANGRFTFGPNGAGPKRAYRGMTKNGVGPIEPVSGGGTDRNGRPVPEQFPPDPYALRTPAEALAHYMGGSGEDRNFYFDSVDLLPVKANDFPQMAAAINNGKPGLYPIIDAAGSYNGGTLGKAGNVTSAATVGGLSLRANGVLAVTKDGTYHFNGRLSADRDLYDFNKRLGRTPFGNLSTAIGRQLPGKEFWVNMIGSKPFSTGGRRSYKR